MKPRSFSTNTPSLIPRGRISTPLPLVWGMGGIDDCTKEHIYLSFGCIARRWVRFFRGWMRYNLDELLLQESVLIAIDILTRSPLLYITLLSFSRTRNCIHKHRKKNSLRPRRANFLPATAMHTETLLRMEHFVLNTRSSGLAGSVGDDPEKVSKKRQHFLLHPIFADSCPDSPVPPFDSCMGLFFL